MLGRFMEEELRSQPRILRDRCGAFSDSTSEALKSRRFEMIVLAARGSSDHAALFGRYLFEIHLRVPVVLAAPSVLTKYGAKVRYRNALAIGISQSGAAPDVAEVLESMHEDGHATLAITNTPNSRVSKAASETIDMGLGVERSVAATKTYTASILCLIQIARSLGAELPDPTLHLPTDEWMEAKRIEALEANGAMLRSQTLFALGRGFQFCTALETALKLMECALMPCKAYSTADFQHGPRALADHGSAAIVYGEQIPGLDGQGCHVVAPRPAQDVPEEMLPLWEIVFGQWLALHLARARGLDPDRPAFIEKVTETL